MGRKRIGAGRPVVIKEPTEIGAYNLTAKQKAWLKKCGEKLGISASDFLRDILKKEMKEHGETA
jgi:hypothetical protein